MNCFRALVKPSTHFSNWSICSSRWIMLDFHTGESRMTSCIVHMFVGDETSVGYEVEEEDSIIVYQSSQRVWENGFNGSRQMKKKEDSKDCRGVWREKGKRLGVKCRWVYSIIVTWSRNLSRMLCYTWYDGAWWCFKLFIVVVSWSTTLIQQSRPLFAKPVYKITSTWHASTSQKAHVVLPRSSFCILFVVAV